MPLARTNEGTANHASNVTTITTGSFTPPNNSILLACGNFLDANMASNTMTCSGGGLTWTKQLDAPISAAGHRTVIWSAPVGTGASMTVTMGTLNGGAGEGTVLVYAYTGYNTSSPFGATITGSAANPGGAAVDLTLNASPATTSECIAVMGCDTGSGSSDITAGTGWTEQDHVNDTANVDSDTETRTNSTSTNVHWNSVGGEYSAAAIEVKAAAGTFTWLDMEQRSDRILRRYRMVAYGKPDKPQPAAMM